MGKLEISLALQDRILSHDSNLKVGLRTFYTKMTRGRELNATLYGSSLASATYQQFMEGAANTELSHSILAGVIA